MSIDLGAQALDQLPQPVVVTGRLGDVLLCNAAACRLLRLAAPPVAGVTLEGLLDAGDGIADVRAALRVALDRRVGCVQVPRAGGGLELRQFDVGNGWCGWVLSSPGQDEPPVRARGAASLLRHELMTPLGALRGLATLLRDGFAGPLSSPQAELVADLLACAEELNALVAELSAPAPPGPSPAREPAQ